VQTDKPSATNPMFPAKFKVPFEDRKTGDKTKDCIKVCKDNGTNVVNQHNQRYGLSPGDQLDETGSRYMSGDNECECKVKRRHNVMDNLCFMDNDKAKITLRSSYGFKVQGKGELILVKAEADKKLAPKPTITSSAGPLTVTTYFVSDIHVPEKTKTSIMFVQIVNDGDGTAEINNLKINSVAIGATPLPLESGMVKISQCQPSGKVSIAKDGITLSCPVVVDDSIVKTKVTGAYLTAPVIVDVDYKYTQTHSVTINVKKESIPGGVDDIDQIRELNRQFDPLPYYCPTQEVTDPDTGKVTKPLRIYDAEVTIQPAQPQQPPSITITSIGGDSSEPYETNDNTPDVVFTTDKSATCRISSTDQSYDEMGNLKHCIIGQGSTSHTCTSETLSLGGQNLYISCRDDGNVKHDSSNNKDISLVVTQ
ncbi:MAG: hypothetical protein AABW61_01925, partial [Candidatus Aenigmatarchaeota archaeon]